jgi:mannose-6-phosphate isomerase-like protein (cupin superfamily)
MDCSSEEMVMRKIWLAICALSLFGVAAQAQTGEKKADYFPAQDVQKQLDDLVSKSQSSGSGGATLGDYGSHKIQLSVRTTSGGAEIHGHYDDIFIVKQGHAILTTGGTIADAKSTPDGETKGSSISNGHTQEIATGDVVNVPAGTPHQLKIAQGTTFSTIVVKVRE